MRFRGRRGGAAVATYAAVLDGAHLWLDVDAPTVVASGTPTTKAVTELR